MRAAWIIIGVALMAGIGFQMAVASHGFHHTWERIPGFWGLLGLGGGALLIVLSALLRRLGVKRKEDSHGTD